MHGIRILDGDTGVAPPLEAGQPPRDTDEWSESQNGEMNLQLAKMFTLWETEAKIEANQQPHVSIISLTVESDGGTGLHKAGPPISSYTTSQSIDQST
ncbi:hypothetical protein E4U17_006272 [Claviceps sp. LM77 group G4]|nr:hypothetical protein E4U17_006272 [Claviceps sp. LM77 group G4]